MAFLGTESYPFTVQFVNGNFVLISQFPSGPQTQSWPRDLFTIETHPTFSVFVSLGAEVPFLTYNYTLCTNVVQPTRDLWIAAVLALATPPPAAVTDVNIVSPLPVPVDVVSSVPISVSVSNFPATQPVSGTVTANQGTNPWVCSVTNFPASQTVNGTVSVTQPVVVDQGTSPWVTSVSNFPAIQPVSGTVSVTQPVVVDQGTSPWVTSVSNFPATQPVSGTVTALQGTSPWVVNETQIGGAAYTLGQNTMANSAPVVLASNQSAIPVTGTVTSSQPIPATTDIVGASRTTTGTLVVIPAGRTFFGSMSLSCSISVAGNNQPTISAAGAGVVPTGTLHQIVASGLALTVVANSNTISDVYIFGGAAGATVTFTTGASGISTGQIAGRLL